MLVEDVETQNKRALRAEGSLILCTFQRLNFCLADLKLETNTFQKAWTGRTWLLLCHCIHSRASKQSISQIIPKI